MADLQEVNQTLKEQNELLKGNRALEVENKREADHAQHYIRSRFHRHVHRRLRGRGQ